MALRRGNIELDQAGAAEAPPTFDMQDPGAGSPPQAAAPAQATPPGQVPPPQQATPVQATPPPQATAPATTAPQEQARAADVVATQVAPNPTPVAVEDPPTQLPATREAGAGALTTAGVGDSMTAALENDGFEGLEFGFGAFPQISLQNNGTFEYSGGGLIGIDFYCIILGSKAKYIYKNGQKKALEDFVYSYDKEYTLQGGLVQAKLDEWVGKGWVPEEKKYLDVQAQIVSNDQHNGELVLLSIPPNSINRFSGYIATVQGRHGKSIKKVITHCYLGDRVTKGEYPFNPWAFAMYGDAPE